MKKIVLTQEAPAPIGPYSQGIDTGSLVFFSGQLGIDPKTGEMGKNVTEQTELAMKSVGALLKAAGLGYEDVVKTLIFVQSMSDFGEVNRIYGEYFKNEAPARSCVEVAALPKGGLVEIEVIALRK